jgi:hypothetical protein
MHKISIDNCGSVLAAGNDGAAGPFYASAGAGGKGAIAVASAENTVVPTFAQVGSFSTGNGTKEDFQWTFESYWGGTWQNVTAPLRIINFDRTETDDGQVTCSLRDTSVGDLSKNVVIVQDDSYCTTSQQAPILQAHNVRYILDCNYDGTTAVSQGNDTML